MSIESQLLNEVKEKDLRIGNYVYYCENGNTLYAEFEKIETYDMIGLANGGEIFGVPIDENFLVTWFGFEKNNIEYVLQDWMLGLYYDDVYGYWHVYECRDNFHIRTIKYLHELQNLYFALTGNELKERNFSDEFNEDF